MNIVKYSYLLNTYVKLVTKIIKVLKTIVQLNFKIQNIFLHLIKKKD